MPGSQFFTGLGDDGYTGLLNSERVAKYDLRPEAYGTVDEAQAALGVARACNCTPRTGKVLLAVQRDLYVLMAELAAAGDPDSPFANRIGSAHIEQLEGWIADFEAGFELPKEFVIPGDSQPGAALHLARTVVRRAERLAVQLCHRGPLGNELVVRYLNRLSSLLFLLALFEDQQATGSELTLARQE
jgi:cob(I)alamin adenosyltransferase